jgi:hypothetical protein
MFAANPPQLSKRSRIVVRAALLMALALLPECSDVGVRSEEMPPPALDLRYRNFISQHIKGVFKDYALYGSFEISNLRWVHSIEGWAWLVCVGFQDQGHARIYAVFFKDSAVLGSRYAVQTDACNTQTYASFNEMGPPRPGVLEPLH